MNLRVRKERNLILLLFLGVLPLLLLSAPLPYLSALATDDALGLRADRNRDGFIDRQEAALVPGLLPIFAMHDTNGDGKLDRSELARVRTALRKMQPRVMEARL
jgi:hypothetical protein